jgi:flavin-dependent dehydrogenase
MYNSMCETEVFVCGGGPAGLAAAIAARMAGFKVTVADFAQPPIDKVCGEGLMPEGLSALDELGVKLNPAEGHAFEGIRFVDAVGETDGRFAGGRGLGVRRPVLHQAMIDRAAELGVSMHWGVRVSAISSSGVTINGQSIRTRWVVCADGQRSKLRDLAGLSAGTTERRRYGFRRHYRVAPWSNLVEVYWADLGQMYITPVSADEVCVAFVTRRTGLQFDEALPHFPELRERLAGAQATRVKGAVTTTRKLRAVQRNHIALIGDASGSVDPVTGEGLALAFQQAVALADAMRRDDLAAYEAAHRRISRLPHVMAELMLAMDAHPNFRRRVFKAFAADQNLFQRMLEIHTGAVSPFQFGVRGSLLLGWRLLTA